MSVPVPVVTPVVEASKEPVCIAVVGLAQTGQPVGELRRAGPREWLENGTAGAVPRHFEEAGRDSGSMVLFDRSRNVTLRLDFRTGKVLRGESGGPLVEMYEIQRLDTGSCTGR